jgi:hypothetical protein
MVLMMKSLRSLSMTLRSIKLLTALSKWTSTMTTTRPSVLRMALPKVARRVSDSAPMLVAVRASAHASRRRQQLATSQSSAKARSRGRRRGSRLPWSRCLRCLPLLVLVGLGQLLQLQMLRLAHLVAKCLEYHQSRFRVVAGHRYQYFLSARVAFCIHVSQLTYPHSITMLVVCFM